MSQSKKEKRLVASICLRGVFEDKTLEHCFIKCVRKHLSGEPLVDGWTSSGWGDGKNMLSVIMKESDA